MNATLPTPTDASALAAAVRQLGIEAHRLLADPSCPPSEVHDLSRRLAALRGQLPHRSSTTVSRWIDKLDARLRAAAIDN